MIIVNLLGGLGNQMFQAAAGLSLSLKINTSLKFDLRFFEANSKDTNEFTSRGFSLDKLCKNLLIAEKKDISLFFPEETSSYIVKIKSYFLRPIILKDSWNPEVFNRMSSINIYIDGFWQSEDYFKEYKSDIQNFFHFPDIRSDLFKKYEQIKKLNSVSVHFRRGDYINKDYTRAIHSVCDMNYYYRAIKYLSAKQKDIKLFLFSDEPEWLSENFNSEIAFEIINTQSDISDMHLMSLCKHNIIANSSFSWWGAWLNKNPQKIVIAPEKWFATDIVSYERVVPESWIKI